MSKQKSRCLRIGSTLDLISLEYLLAPASSRKILRSYTGKLSCFRPSISHRLPAQHRQRTRDARARRLRHDYFVDIAALGADEG